MSTEIKHAVVIDNKDIYQTGKIRVLLLDSDIASEYRTKNIAELKNLLFNLDAKGNYKPWQKSTLSKSADPYLAEPFLPKQINLIPEEGQLVKIVTYSDGNFKEYIGPQISSLENQKENYVNSLSEFRNVTKKDLITNGYVNKVSDFGIYGNNSQLIFGDKEMFFRTNFQDFNGKKKNIEQTIFQQSTFNSTLNSEKKITTTIEEPEKVISHLLDVFILKKVRTVANEKTITASIKLVNILHHKNNNGRLGVTNKTFEPNNQYMDGHEDLDFTLQTDDANDVSKFIDELRSGLVNKKLEMLATLTDTIDGIKTTINTDSYSVEIKDSRMMTQNHVVITDRKEVELFGFVIRVRNTQLFETTAEALEILGISDQYLKTNPKFYAKEKNNLIHLNTIINRYANNNKVEGKFTNDNPKAITKETSKINFEDKKDTFTVTASKKLLFLSTQVTPNLISSNPSQYGFTQQELVDLIDPKKLNTFSSVRGERLIEMMITLINLFLQHGHSTGNTVKNSLEDDTRNKLIAMKEELTKKVNTDLTGGPNLLNPYIRIN